MLGSSLAEMTMLTTHTHSTITSSSVNSSLLTYNTFSGNSSHVSQNGLSIYHAPVMASKICVPKTPRPHRYLCMMENVIAGLSATLSDLRAKVADLTTAVTNGYTAMTKVRCSKSQRRTRTKCLHFDIFYC